MCNFGFFVPKRGRNVFCRRVLTYLAAIFPCLSTAIGAQTDSELTNDGIITDSYSGGIGESGGSGGLGAFMDFDPFVIPIPVLPGDPGLPGTFPLRPGGGVRGGDGGGGGGGGEIAFTLDMKKYASGVQLILSEEDEQ